MSLSSTYSEVYYTADGITSTFSFGNYFTGISSDYVKCIVYIDNSPLIPTYTVNLSVGGLTIVAITTPEGEALNLPPAGSIVRIYRDVPEAQNITASELQNFTATQLEKSFDDIVGMIQEISYTLANKTINLTETNRAMSIDFLDSTNDGCIFYWDSANNKLVPTNYSEDEIVLSSSVRYLKYNAGVFSFSTNGTTWNALLQESNITSLREQVATNTENIATNTADILANETILNDHIADLDNPHETTKAQVGLGNADNTSDIDKPISTATQAALDTKQATLTTPQLSAVNSGIDSTKVAQIATNTTNIALKLDSNQGSTNVGKIMAVGTDGELYPSSESGGIVSVIHDTTLTGSGIESIPLGVSSSLLTTINGKQDALTTEQQAAVNSGIDSTKVEQIATNTTNINNKADKDLGNLSSVGENKINSTIARGISLSFEGTKSGTVITFESNTVYDIDNNYEYEIDLLLPIVGTIPDTDTIQILNGTEYIKIVNPLHRTVSSDITWGDLKQVMRYNTETGYRFLFKARCKTTSSNIKVFLIYPVIINFAEQGDSLFRPITNQEMLDAITDGVNATYRGVKINNGDIFICADDNGYEIGNVYKWNGSDWVQIIDISNKLDSNQGSTNAGKVMTVGLDGLLTPETSTVPVGQIVPYVCTSSYIPDGCLPCDGTEYSQSQFPALWTNYLTSSPVKLQTCTYAEYASDITTYGQCGKFAIDTVNETFKVPTIKDGAYLTQAKTDAELGKAYNESLPNIKGKIEKSAGGVITNSGVSGSGAFSTTQTSDLGISNSAIYGGSLKVSFDASRSSSTYQDGAKVQGDNIRVRFFVVVANAQINQSQMDWSAWATSLAGKANTDMDNITATGKETVVGWGMPDYTSTVSISMAQYNSSSAYWVAPYACQCVFTSSDYMNNDKDYTVYIMDGGTQWVSFYGGKQGGAGWAGVSPMTLNLKAGTYVYIIRTNATIKNNYSPFTY